MATQEAPTESQQQITPVKETVSNFEPASKRRRLSYGNVITVTAGEECEEDAEVFTVHADVITKSSSFFEKARNDSSKEAQEDGVRLPEIEADTFRSYLHWIYSGNVVIEVEGANTEALRTKAEKLVKLYTCAEMLGDMRLRNAVIDALLERRGQYKAIPNPDAVSHAYGKTAENSPLRKLLVAQYLAMTARQADWFKACGHRLPFQFLFDLVHARMVNNNEKTNQPTCADRARYHEGETKEAAPEVKPERAPEQIPDQAQPTQVQTMNSTQAAQAPSVQTPSVQTPSVQVPSARAQPAQTPSDLSPFHQSLLSQLRPARPATVQTLSSQLASSPNSSIGRGFTRGLDFELTPAGHAPIGRGRGMPQQAPRRSFEPRPRGRGTG